MATDIAKNETEIDLYSPAAVETAWNEADEVLGFTLIKDENRAKLVGVPFLITRVIFRDGTGMFDKDHKFDYVTCEAIVAPQAAYDKAAQMGLFAPAQVPFAPMDRVVFNDGSTGVFRQIVAYLSARDLIDLGDTTAPEEGGKGESRYDRPHSVWSQGGRDAEDGISVTLRASRGLRFSQYSNEHGDAETYYLG